MADIFKIFLIHTTSKRENANTDAEFELIIQRPNNFDLRLNFPSLDHDEHEKGRT
jgi:hypothetical protein